MEVHHHPNVENKRFKEYLLEGVMIFIAVTIGFFAESLRESINNREKEHEYIKSLINNLVDDSTNIIYTIKDNQYKIKMLDSLLSLAGKNISDNQVRRLLYIYSNKSVSFYSGYGSNDATMMQLKNAGGFQYIKHEHIADSIAAYDNFLKGIFSAETPYANAINNAMDALSEILVFRAARDTTLFNEKNDAGKKEIPLLTADPVKLEIFFNKIYSERGWTINYVNNLLERQPYMTRLIRLLKKDYHIE